MEGIRQIVLEAENIFSVERVEDGVDLRIGEDCQGHFDVTLHILERTASRLQ